MKISWHGHACISINIDGYIVVIDPHDGASIGLKKPGVKGDLILVTHDHFDHNAVNAVSKDKSRVLKMFHGETIIDNLRITGLKTYHDKHRGRRRGENSIYIVEYRDMKLAHLGDLGEIPDSTTLGKIKGIQLLVIPVGGTFTIEPDEAWSIVEKTRPLNVFPIHYWIPGITLPLKPIDDFLKYVRNYDVVKLNTNEFDLKDHVNKVIVAKPP